MMTSANWHSKTRKCYTNDHVYISVIHLRIYYEPQDATDCEVMGVFIVRWPVMPGPETVSVNSVSHNIYICQHIFRPIDAEYKYAYLRKKHW